MADAEGNRYGPYDIEVPGSEAEAFTEDAWYLMNRESGVMSGGALTFTGLTAHLAPVELRSHGSFLARDTEWTDTSPATSTSAPRRDMLVARRQLTTGEGAGAVPGKTFLTVLRGDPAAIPAEPSDFDPDTDEPLWSWQVPGGGGTVVTNIRDLRQPADAPRWESFTPAFTSEGGAPAVGNGALLGRSWRHGRAITVRIVFTVGSTTNAGTGGLSFSLPVPAANDGFEQDVLAKAFTADGRPWAGNGYIPSGSTTVRPFLPKGPTPDLGWARGADASGAPGTGVPLVSGDFTFKPGSILVISGTYEGAS